MRVLVTGATGFIGRHLMQALEKKLGENDYLCGVGQTVKGSCWHWHKPGPQVVRARMDLCDPWDVHSGLEAIRPDCVFHLAGNPNVRLADDDPRGERMWQTNVDATRRLLDLVPQGCRFIYASSATVYAAHCLAQYSGADEGDLLWPESLYGASKVSGEALVNAHTRLGRIRGVNLRYIACVGPGATHGVVLDFVKKLRSDSPTFDLLGGAPGSTKPFLHVRDAAAATVLAGFSRTTGSLNIGPQDAITVATLAHLAMDTLGVEKPLRWLGEEANWQGDNPVVRVANDRLVSMGWQPAYPTSKQAVVAAFKELGALIQ